MFNGITVFVFHRGAPVARCASLLAVLIFIFPAVTYAACTAPAGAASEVCGDPDAFGFTRETGLEPKALTATMTMAEGPADPTVNAEPPSKRVFVSSAAYDGAFGGIEAADAHCQNLADVAALGGTWKAWLSDSSMGDQAQRRLAHHMGKFRLLDGTVVADGWADLTDATLDNPINRDENNTLRNGVTVHTGTAPNGATATTTFSEQCEDWTFNAARGSGPAANDRNSTRSGTYGNTSHTATSWTNAGSGQCSNRRRLYCFEQ